MPVGVGGDLNRAVAHLLFHVHKRGAILEQQGTEGMPQVMQANLAEAGLGEHRLKIAMVKVVRVQDCAIGRREDQIVGNVFLPLEERFQEALVPKVEQRFPKLAREINAPALLALCRGVLSSDVVVLNHDKAIRVVIVPAELDVAPLQCHQLSPAKSSPKGRQKQRVVFHADGLRGLKELLRLFAGQRDSLGLTGSWGTSKPAESRGRVGFDYAAFNRVVEDGSNDAHRVADRVPRQFVGNQIADHGLDGGALHLVKPQLAESWAKIQPQHAFISVRSRGLALHARVIF